MGTRMTAEEVIKRNNEKARNNISSTFLTSIVERLTKRLDEYKSSKEV